MKGLKTREEAPRAFSNELERQWARFKHTRSVHSSVMDEREAEPRTEKIQKEMLAFTEEIRVQKEKWISHFLFICKEKNIKIQV